jgi:hypothetical protein
MLLYMIMKGKMDVMYLQNGIDVIDVVIEGIFK